MKKLFVFLIAMLVSAFAVASPPMNTGLKGSYPTERTDGTPFSQSEIQLLRVECGVSSGDYQLVKDYQPPPATLAVSKEALMADMNLTYDVDYWCVASVRDTGDRNSARSNEVNFHVPAPEVQPPAAPSVWVD